MSEQFLNNSRKSSQCRDAQSLLSEYADNALSARQTWEVEKHLALCRDCAEVSRQMQATVALLRRAEKHDTADDFMAKLHARLDRLEPTRSRRSLKDQAQDWLIGVRDSLRTHRVPALSLGVSMAAVVALLVLLPNRAEKGFTVPPTGSGISVPAPTEALQHNLQRNVALSARDPFADPAAENLSAQSLTDERSPVEAE